MSIQNIVSVDIKKLAVALCSYMAFLFIAFNVSAGDYLNSSHGNGTTGVDRSIDTNLAGYSRGNCAHCHLQHASLSGTVYTFGDYLLYNGVSGYAFCNDCHDADGPATDDIGSLYGLTYGHGVTGNEVNCTECHNPHQAQAPTSEAVRGNDATTGSVKGVSGVEPDLWPNPTATAGSEPVETALAPASYTVVDPATKEYQVCFKCHSNYNLGPVSRTNTPSGQLTNQAAHFNPNNFAFHPVTDNGSGLWNNNIIRNNPTSMLNTPWSTNVNARMYCSDCHADPVAPRGSHGSNSTYMLRATGPGISIDNLCLICHQNPQVAGTANTLSLFPDHDRGQHKNVADGGQSDLGCLGCHGGNTGVGGRVGNIHGTKYQWVDGPAGATDPGMTSATFLIGGYLIELYLDGGTDKTCTITGCGTHTKSWP